MADVAVGAHHNQTGGIFHRALWLANDLQEHKTVQRQDYGKDKEQPGNNLVPRQGIMEPDLQVQQDQSQYCLESKKNGKNRARENRERSLVKPTQSPGRPGQI